MDQAADVLLRSLGDSGRRQVARILAEVPLTVGEIAEVLGMPQSTVSRHLKSLRATGLLVDRREGPRVYIELTEPRPNGTNGTGDLGQVLNQWLRRQPLSGAIESRLHRAVEARGTSDDTFERLADQWDELRCEHFGDTFQLEAVASLLPPEWRVLDAGTGTGYLLPFLGSHFRSVVAADSSPTMLDLARQRASRARLENVEFRPGRLEALPLDDSSIDCAIAMLVLRHSSDLDQALAELARVLVAGGRLLVVDVCSHSMEDFRRRIGDASRGLEPSVVEHRLERAGFDISCRRRMSPLASGGAGPLRPAPDLFLISCERRARVRRPKSTTTSKDR